MREGWLKRWRRKHGDFAVPCIVTGRWLEFSQSGSAQTGDGEAINLSVMIDPSGDKPRKLCELFVTREELLRVLSLIERASPKR